MAERRKGGGVQPNKYSIYAARDAQRSNVDWGKIAGDLTTTLSDIAISRKARKAAIEEQTRQDVEKLSEVQDIGNQDAQSLLIRGSNMSKENLLIQSDLMKRGILKPEDLQIFSQSLKTGYKNLSTATKNYDGWYQKAMAAVKDGSASSIEQYANETTSSFGNLKDKMLWTNPNNGQLQMVSMGQSKDGSYDIMPDPKKSPERFLNPNSMNTRMQYKNKTRILKDEVNNIVEPLAEFIKSFRDDDDPNKIVTREDFRRYGKFGEGETYETWLEDQIDLLTVDPNNATQILTDNGYFIASTEAEFKLKHPGVGLEKFIKGDTSTGTVVLTLDDDQQGRAEDLAEAAIETAIGFKSSSTGTPYKSTPYDDGVTEEQENLIGALDDVNTLVSGSQDEFESTSRDRIVSLNKLAREKGQPLIDSIDRQSDKIVITYQDGTVEQPIKRFNKDGTPKPAEEISQELWRYVTNEDDNSYKKAVRLYEMEENGGFRSTDRDEESEETRSRVLNDRAVDKLVKSRLAKEGKNNPTDEEINKERAKLLESKDSEDDIKLAVIEETNLVKGTDEGARESLKNLGNSNPSAEEIKKAKQTITEQNEKEIQKLKKRILKGKKASQYSSLPPIGKVPVISDANVVATDKLGAPTIVTGAQYLEDQIGNVDKLDSDTKQTAAYSKVLNSYLPKDIQGGARVIYDRGDTGANVLEIEYFDRFGKIKVIKYQIKESLIGALGGTKSAEIDKILHDAAKTVKNAEDERRRTRSEKDVKKKRTDFQRQSGNSTGSKYNKENI